MSSPHAITPDLLPEQLQVWRLTSTTDDGGGRETTWAQVATLPGRISQPTTRERQTAQADGSDLSPRVYLAPRVDVRRGDQLRTDRGLVLQVTAVFEPSEPVYTRCDVELRQPEGSRG
ncbi:head-tail adaptor protein [Pseudonocardia sp. RS010]|uniref:phage head completion protein n=1 Tax=Pseudonocardia sp. RS010 TaxID=3385979 RepID=UPI0039A11CC0